MTDEAGPPPDQQGAEVQAGVGVPDAIQRLWMPHRMAYIKGEGKLRKGRSTETGRDGSSEAEEGRCPFCVIPTLPDDEGLVLARGAQVFAVLNLYPYNGGHLMICPYRHVADYTDLTDAEVRELATFTQRAMSALRSASDAQGFNIGLNQGPVAGAGIAEHLHQHVVPRWGGDTNFMPVIGRTKVLPQLLRDTRQLVAEAWPRG